MRLGKHSLYSRIIPAQLRRNWPAERQHDVSCDIAAAVFTRAAGPTPTVRDKSADRVAAGRCRHLAAESEIVQKCDVSESPRRGCPASHPSLLPSLSPLHRRHGFLRRINDL